MSTPFAGFPSEAIGFLNGLEKHNNREWFQAHKDVYESACREPMKSLVAELAPRFGTGKIMRINRDMRFVQDRAPYRTHIAAGVGGHYISLSKEGLYVGTGIYKPDSASLERFRNAVDADKSGRVLAALVAALRRKGYQVETHERVARAPRGYAADHPRIDLIRMKDIFAGKLFEPAPWLATRKALDRIARVMVDTKPLKDWLVEHVGASRR